MKNIYLLLFLFFINCVPGFGQKRKDEPTNYKDDLSFKWKKESDTLKVMATNKLLTSVQVFFYSKKNNKALQSFLLMPKDSLSLLSYCGALSDSTYISLFSDSIRITYIWGHPSQIDPDLDYLYRLPFKAGKKYKVSQGFFGQFSHNTEKSRYAIDFVLRVGEPIYAAREGIVVKVIDWFTKQGGKELIHAANKIIILHPDGTLAFYVHLKYKGSLVKEGEVVERGQKIGLSGLTGYTSGPHLHFVVRKEKDIAIPIYFEGYEGKILKKGKKYKVIE